jgi:hypothetical protein
MFETPADSSPIVEPGRYLVKLFKLEPTSHPQYGAGVKWVFVIATPDGKPLYDKHNAPLELWQTTSLRLTPNSKARPWVEALLDRPLTNGEDPAAIAQAIVGKKAYALIGLNDKGYSTVLQLNAYRDGQGAAAANGAAATPSAAAPPAPGVSDEPGDAFVF